MNLGLKPLSFTSLSALWKSGDGVSDHFPAGLRVLVVDDDPTCLAILDKMLKNCLYQVTTCNRAELALRLLRDNKNGFDVVISDVHMPDMDGFKLLEHVGLEMDLPVIMMSADDSKNIVMKGVTHGACDYLIKPVRMEALKNIWQHVVRKRVEWKEKDFEQADDGEQQQKPSEEGNYLEGNWQSSKKRKDEEDEAEERDDPSSLKKPRVVWSVELHQQFVNAVNQLGIDKAVPKKILELMNVPGLTRENVASHLQKYRLYLRRLSGVSQHHNSFLGPSDAPFGPISSLDLQALAASVQLPPSAVTIPLSDQTSLFNFESRRLSFVEGQQEQNSNRKQASLLHGVPTNMDLNQMAVLPSRAHSQSSQSSILPSQMVQMRSRTQIFNETSGSHVLNLPFSVDHHILTMPCLEYPLVSQPSSGVDLSKSQNTEFPLINFSHGSYSGASSSTHKLQDEVSSEMKGSQGFFPNYNDVNRTGPWDRDLNSGGSIFDAPQQLQRGLNVLPSVSVQQRFFPNQTGEPTGIPSDKSVFSVAEVNQQLNTSAANNLLLAKAQRPDKSFKNSLFPEIFHPDDLMTAVLNKQQENRLESVGTELGFNG